MNNYFLSMKEKHRRILAQLLERADHSEKPPNQSKVGRIFSDTATSMRDSAARRPVTPEEALEAQVNAAGLQFAKLFVRIGAHSFRQIARQSQENGEVRLSRIKPWNNSGVVEAACDLETMLANPQIVSGGYKAMAGLFTRLTGHSPKDRYFARHKDGIVQGERSLTPSSLPLIQQRDYAVIQKIGSTTKIQTFGLTGIDISCLAERGINVVPSQKFGMAISIDNREALSSMHTYLKQTQHLRPHPYNK